MPKVPEVIYNIPRLHDLRAIPIGETESLFLLILTTLRIARV